MDSRQNIIFRFYKFWTHAVQRVTDYILLGHGHEPVVHPEQSIVKVMRTPSLRKDIIAKPIPFDSTSKQ